MNDFSYFLLLIAAAAIFLVVMRHVYLLLQFLNWRMRAPVFTPIPREAVPSVPRRILDCALPKLTALGFEYRISNSYPDFMASGTEPQYADSYWHAQEKTMAFVSVAEAPEVDFLYAVTFETFFSDGHSIETINCRRHLLITDVEAERLMRCEIADPYLATCREQWDFHLQRLRTREGMNGLHAAPIPERQNYGETWEKQQQRRHNLPETLQASGIWRPATHAAGDGPLPSVEERSYRLTLSAAWRMVQRSMAGMRRLNKIALPAQVAPERYERRAEADFLAFARNKQVLTRTKFSRRARFLIFLCSMFAGLVAFGLLLGWHLLPVLFAVLLFHEFGHALAMRGFGFKNVTVFVVPLFGAVATGRREDTKPWQLLLIYLAGPLPGLLLGMALLFLLLNGAFGHDWLCNPESGCQVVTNGALGAPPIWLFSLIGMALILNYFNLLPLVPLDGGQILEVFVFSRHAYARVSFWAVSCLGAIALGLYASIPLLLVLGFFLLFSVVPSIWRLAHLQHQAQTGEGVSAVPGGRFASICTLLTRERYRKLRFVARFQTAWAVEQRMSFSPPGRGVTCAALLVYGAVLFVPPFLLFTDPALEPLKNAVMGIFGKKSAQDAEHRAWQEKVSPVYWEEKIARAKNDDERWQVITDAADWMAWEKEDPESAHAYYVRAEDLSHRFDADDPRRIESRFNLAMNTADAKEARNQYEALLADLYRRPQGRERYIARILMVFYRLDSHELPEVRIRYPAEAYFWFENVPADDSYRHEKFDIRYEYAWMLDRVGNSDDAGKLLRQNLEEAEKIESLGLTELRASEFGWFLIAQGRADEAQAMLESRLQRPLSKDGSFFVESMREALAWSLLVQGQNGAAEREFLARWQRFERKNPHAADSVGALNPLLDLVYAATRAGDSATATAHRSRIETLLKAQPSDVRAMLARNSILVSDGNHWRRLRDDARWGVLREIAMPFDQ